MGQIRSYKLGAAGYRGMSWVGVLVRLLAVQCRGDVTGV